MLPRILVLLLGISLSGCALAPDVSHQPTLHNPFPQISSVAIAPFMNQSEEPTLDGRQFAMAYQDELQSVPGYEVVPVGVVEQVMLEQGIELTDAEAAQRLAQALNVDAIVIGAVTDFTPYYPPRCSMQVQWYAANPCFHSIPPGYGLPWGTPEEESIPGPLVFEAEMALARAQLDTQTPIPPQPTGTGPVPSPIPDAPNGSAPLQYPGVTMSHEASVGAEGGEVVMIGGAEGEAYGGGLPPNWPDPRGFIPPGPSPVRPSCKPTVEPVMQIMRAYKGNDAEFTAALESYCYFQDDARFGGWQGYLRRSDDFIRFCCHMSIWEMLSARGGAGETRVVWRWHDIR